MQIGLVATEAASSSNGLIEGRPNSIAWPYLRDESLAVGRPELLNFSILQQQFDHRVVTSQLFQRRCIGRVAGLGLLLRGQTELLEQNLPQLLRRVDVEVFACGFDSRLT